MIYKRGSIYWTKFQHAGRMIYKSTGQTSATKASSERQRDGLQISSINSCLRCLRRVLKLAEEWGVLTKAPRVKFLPGEHCRERVLSPQEEQLYMAASAPLLHDVSAVLFDN